MQSRPNAAAVRENPEAKGNERNLSDQTDIRTRHYVFKMDSVFTNSLCVAALHSLHSPINFVLLDCSL